MQNPSELEPAAGPNVPALIRLAELRSEKEKLDKIRRLRQENGLAFYRPHLKQHKFHTCDKTGRYLRTGNRFGKSDCGIAESLSYALGGRLWYRHTFDILGSRNVAPAGQRPVWETYVDSTHVGSHLHPFVTAGIPQRPVKGLILVVDWDMAKKIFTNREGSYEVWGKLWKLLPTEAIGKITNGGRGDRIEKIEIKRPTEFGGGSSTISFDTVESYKHNKVGAESADWDFIHVDEPVPEKLFKAHARGMMDRDGSYWFTCTPLDEMWINDLFCPPGQHILKDADTGYSFARKYIITGSIYDNPYRNDAGIAEYESTLTREEKACRLYGLPAAFAGLVYKEFVHDLHVLCELPKGWTDYNNPPLDYTIRVAWDVHDSKPQAVLFVATAPTGEIFVYDELFFDRIIQTNAELVKEKLHRRHVVDYLIDPRAVIDSPVTNESILDELNKYDLYFEEASKDLTLGISKVREKLMERLPSGGATIYFSPDLAETLFEFSHYIYNSETGKVKDKDDHMMENLYRLVLNGLDYVHKDYDVEPKGTLRVRPNEDQVSLFRNVSLSI